MNNFEVGVFRYAVGIMLNIFQGEVGSPLIKNQIMNLKSILL